MTIDTLLLDADGVLQRPVVRWDKAREPILDAADASQVRPFLRDILEAERAVRSPSGWLLHAKTGAPVIGMFVRQAEHRWF